MLPWADPVALRRDTPQKRSDALTAMSLADYADPSQQPSLGSVLGQQGSAEKLDFLLAFPDMRQSVIAAINELNDEVRCPNLHVFDSVFLDPIADCCITADTAGQCAINGQ